MINRKIPKTTKIDELSLFFGDLKEVLRKLFEDEDGIFLINRKKRKLIIQILQENLNR